MKIQFITLCLSLFIISNIKAQWTKISPEYGRNDFIIDSSGTFYSLSFGLYKSSNEGISWQYLNFKQFLINTITLLPNDRMLVFAEDLYIKGSGSNEFQIFPHPLSSGYIIASYFIGNKIYLQQGNQTYYTSNYGLSYDSLNFRIKSVIEQSGNLIAVGNDGILKSSDNGLTWISSNNGISTPDFTNLNSILLLNNNLYVSTGFGGNKMYKSSDGGNTWNIYNNGLSYSVDKIKLINNQIVAYDNTSAFGYYILDELNNNWEYNPSFSTSGSKNYINYYNGYKFFTYGGNVDGLSKTNDNGITWIDCFNGLKQSFVVNLRKSNGHLFSVNGFSVHEYDSLNNTWNRLYYRYTSSSINRPAPGEITINSVNNILYLSTFSGLFFSNDNGLNWSLLATNLTGNIVSINYFNNRLFANCNNGIFYCDDNSGNFTSSQTQLNNYNLLFNDNGVLYTSSSNDIYKSLNNGLNWSLFFTYPWNGTSATTLSATNSSIIAAKSNYLVFQINKTNSQNEATNFSGFYNATSFGNNIYTTSSQGLFIFDDNVFPNSPIDVSNDLEYSSNPNLFCHQFGNNIELFAGKIFLSTKGNGIFAADTNQLSNLITTYSKLNIKVEPFKIIENPFKNELKIEINETADPSHICLFNQLGIMIYETESTSSNLNIPTSNLANGIYILKVKLKSNTYIKKLIKI